MYIYIYVYIYICIYKSKKKKASTVRLSFKEVVMAKQFVFFLFFFSLNL